MFRREMTRLDCVNKCGGLGTPRCRLQPTQDVTNCTNSCQKCLRSALNTMEGKCVKETGKAPNPTTVPAQSQSTRPPPPLPCVSTSWLARQGLSQHVIYNGGQAHVICIPGLPCGTSGHLLRVCRAGRASCTLVSYASLCKERDDCSNSEMSVSQLSHSYDWSVFRISSPSSDSSIELTSLSQNHGANEFSPSNVVARITADLLNRNGYGHVCNAIARVPHSIRKVRYLFGSADDS